MPCEKEGTGSNLLSEEEPHSPFAARRAERKTPRLPENVWGSSHLYTCAIATLLNGKIFVLCVHIGSINISKYKEDDTWN